MTEFDDAWEELQAVQTQVSAALNKAALVANEARDGLPSELIEELAETPIEELLRGMVDAKEQADADRAQVARLVVLVERLGLAASTAAEGAAIVAGDLAVARGKADATEGEAGAAADEASKSP